MEKEAATIKQQLMRMNMIPGTGTYSRAGKGDDPQFSEEEYSADQGIQISKIRIEVYGTLMAGTTVQRGNREP